MNSKTEAKHLTKSKKLSKKRLVFSIAAAAFLTAAAVFVYTVYGAWNNPAGVLLKEAMVSSDPDAGAEVPRAKDETTAGSIPAMGDGADAGAFADESVLNILLLGIDSDEGREERNMGWRSDMVMLCTLNTQNNAIALTTIPRDTRTEVFHVDEDGNPTRKELTKINHAYSYGGGPDRYGAQNAMLAVGDFLNGFAGYHIPIHYYISIDMENVPKLADAFGGIPVRLDVDFPELGKKGETVVIDSTNVNTYLRNRYDVGGDLARARHHEEFLLSMMKEFKKRGDVKSAAGLLGFAMQYTKTDLDFQQVVALASIFRRCDPDRLDYKVINGEFRYIGGICYYLPDPEDVKNRMDALML